MNREWKSNKDEIELHENFEQVNAASEPEDPIEGEWKTVENTKSYNLCFVSIALIAVSSCLVILGSCMMASNKLLRNLQEESKINQTMSTYDYVEREKHKYNLGFFISDTCKSNNTWTCYHKEDYVYSSVALGVGSLVIIQSVILVIYLNSDKLCSKFKTIKNDEEFKTPNEPINVVSEPYEPQVLKNE